MYCSSCGSQLPEGATHCPTCGAFTPFKVATSGISPYDLTAAISPGATGQDPYGPLDPYDVSPKPLPPPSNRASSWLWVSIIIAVLGLLAAITSGVVSHTITASQMTQSQSQSQILRIPVLRASYTGYSLNEANNAQYSLVITSLVENTTTGDFTATGDLEGCTGSISGVVTTVNEIRFEVIEQPSCQEHTFEYVGSIHAGTLSGTYTAPNFPVDSANHGKWFAS